MRSSTVAGIAVFDDEDRRVPINDDPRTECGGSDEP